MYSNTISLRYFFPRARILNEIAEFEKMPLNRKSLFGLFCFISWMTETFKCEEYSTRQLIKPRALVLVTHTLALF